MEKAARIPMFPLAILPLPGELVPLHIFEPRYRQLLHDMETTDIKFGIYFSHEINAAKIGSLMKLESIIKRYPTGESDIIVKCQDYFYMDLLFRTYKEKLYPGGDVKLVNADHHSFPRPMLFELFYDYLRIRNSNQQFTSLNIYQIANELSLDLHDRYKFLTAEQTQREQLLLNRIKFLTHLVKEEKRSKNVYHLN